jgi:hypothetical protein
MNTVIVVLGNKSGQTSLNRVNVAIAKREELIKMILFKEYGLFYS